MGAFTTAWLDLREPADLAARDHELAEAAALKIGEASDPLVMDLGAGTGSTVRALTPLLSRPVRWRLVDGDAALLAEAARRCGPAAQTLVMDLSGAFLLPLDGVSMLTCSALLDLVSRPFIDRLVAVAASRQLPLYAALTYDGTTFFEPEHALDEAVLAAYDRDQRRDKGFGPALGPDAAKIFLEVLHRAGYEIRTAESPWRLGADEAPLVAELAKGIAHVAAAELDAEAVDEWLAFRLEHLEDGATLVSHVDILAVPG